MTRSALASATANVVRLHALAWRLEALDAAARASGQPRPAAYEALRVEGHAHARSVRLLLDAELARQRFKARTGYR